MIKIVYIIILVGGIINLSYAVGEERLNIIQHAEMVEIAELAGYKIEDYSVTLFHEVGRNKNGTELRVSFNQIKRFIVLNNNGEIKIVPYIRYGPIFDRNLKLVLWYKNGYLEFANGYKIRACDHIADYDGQYMLIELGPYRYGLISIKEPEKVLAEIEIGSRALELYHLKNGNFAIFGPAPAGKEFVMKMLEKEDGRYVEKYTYVLPKPEKYCRLYVEECNNSGDNIILTAEYDLPWSSKWYLMKFNNGEVKLKKIGKARVRALFLKGNVKDWIKRAREKKENELLLKK